MCHDNRSHKQILVPLVEACVAVFQHVHRYSVSSLTSESYTNAVVSQTSPTSAHSHWTLIKTRTSCLFFSLTDTRPGRKTQTKPMKPFLPIKPPIPEKPKQPAKYDVSNVIAVHFTSLFTDVKLHLILKWPWPLFEP